MPRKKPFSGKQKKQQLREKRERQNEASKWQEVGRERIKKINHQPVETSTKHDPNRYRLHFMRESRDEIERRKLIAQTIPIDKLPESATEVDIQDIYQPGSELDMPHRPTWNYKTTKSALIENEEKYFHDYLEQIYTKFADKNLSYFEHNLETWRQLWRVIEMSDVICMVTDVRHPVLHFSPALFEYLTSIKRPMILILNKIDLVPTPLVAAWHDYFKRKFPGLRIICFTSFPKDVRSHEATKKISKRRPVGKRIYTTQIGPQELLTVCGDICQERVDLSAWKTKIETDLLDIGFAGTSSSFPQRSLETGHPNVGKSSLINGLVGRKVVSTSTTPGHTKYFQTFFLSDNVKLCDCPGLVFPSLVDKQFQILSGIYPVSQVQEPYTSVGYLAQRIPLVDMLQLKHPEWEPGNNETEFKWTPWDVCEAWAIKRGFYTAKGGKTDVYRAANNILRWAVDGRICMCMKPPGYTTSKDNWMRHCEAIKLNKLRGISLDDDQYNRGDAGEKNMHESSIVEELYTSESDSADSENDNSSTKDADSQLSDEHDDASFNPYDLLAGEEDN